jgi:hypothetical protein
MARKRLVGKPVLVDKLKPELGAELVDLVVGEAPPRAPEPERRAGTPARKRREARDKKER